LFEALVNILNGLVGLAVTSIGSCPNCFFSLSKAFCASSVQENLTFFLTSWFIGDVILV